MPRNKLVPERLYKYRSFSNWTLSMLVDDVVHYADPRTFNDPLDTKPHLAADIQDAELEAILSQLIKERTDAEMRAAARTILYKGPKTIEHIARHSKRAAMLRLRHIRYYATDPEITDGNALQRFLCQDIELELLRRYTKGVFSMAEQSICPLMWSHYGDQHRGICLGYSVPESGADVYKIRYGGSRAVQASEVAAMLQGDKAAKRKVDEAVLLRKAPPWRYEREWRLIGPQGRQPSPLELEEIIFGVRCDPAVVYAVIASLERRDRPVGFYAIHEQMDTFTLDKKPIDLAEIASSRPNRSLSILEDLDGFLDEPSGNS
ncbi:DUF2971 domain-containing protein [Stenotrophomonas sp. TWI1183]|uniref:DUF2971 domain-containing protein n=1 Tax=Stenotrophomonas sp. TWI1183 TaxID=3136799 RepID=UPI0032082F7A